MALYINILDDFGRPDAVSSLADAIIEAAKVKGIGWFKSEAKTSEAIRQSINEIIRDGRVSVQSPVLKVCPHCERAVPIWHIYPDGSVYCTSCKPKVE